MGAGGKGRLRGLCEGGLPGPRRRQLEFHFRRFRGFRGGRAYARARPGGLCPRDPGYRLRRRPEGLSDGQYQSPKARHAEARPGGQRRQVEQQVGLYRTERKIRLLQCQGPDEGRRAARGHARAQHRHHGPARSGQRQKGHRHVEEADRVQDGQRQGQKAGHGQKGTGSQRGADQRQVGLHRAERQIRLLCCQRSFHRR